MINYTVEDVALLNDLVDLRERYTDKTVHMRVRNDGALTLFDKEDVLYKRPKEVIDKFLFSIVPLGGLNKANKLLYDEPLNKVPLYLNSEKYIGIIARWRLKIGK